MPEVVHDPQSTPKPSQTDVHNDQKQRTVRHLFLQSNNLLRAIFLELSAILLAGHLFYRLGNSWNGVKSFSDGFWVTGAITGGIVGLYVISVIYKPSMIQRR